MARTKPKLLASTPLLGFHPQRVPRREAAGLCRGHEGSGRTPEPDIGPGRQGQISRPEALPRLTAPGLRWAALGRLDT